MAIQFNPKALDAFSNVDFGDENAIANLEGPNGLVQNGKLGSWLLKPFRRTPAEDRNNAVRTELLKALGQAFQLDGVVEQDGKTRFSDEFMDRLADLLGPAFKRGDFGIKGGEVKSGKPLTQRRIAAIFKAAATVKAETPYDANAYAAKADAIADVLKTKDPRAQATISGLGYVKSIKKTIDFLESDLAGFDEACRNPNDLEKVQDWVGRKIQLYIWPEEIAAFLEQADPVAEPDDPGEGWPARRAQIKTYLRNRLETMVKTTIDTCLEARAAGKLDDCMMVVFNGSFVMKIIERDLEQFRRTQLGREVPENANAVGEDNALGEHVEANGQAGQGIE